MSKIPICEAADFINGRAFKPSEWGTEGLPIIRIQNLTGTNETFNFFNGEINPKNLVRHGDILISWSASLGVYRWTRHDAALNQHIFKVVVKPGVLSSYFYYVATHALSQMVAQVHGSTMQHITKDKFDAIPISLPSQPEQKRIAALLEKADRLRRTRRYARQLSDTFLQSVFLEMFGDIPENPRRWKIRQLEDVVQSGRGVTYGIVQAGPNVPDGVPYIKTGDIRDGIIPITGLSRTNRETAASYKRSEVKHGDIVFSIRATVGTCAALPKELDGANLTQGTARIAPSASVKRDYLLWAIRTRGSQEWFMKQVKGTTFFEITLSRLREAPVMVPPLPLQQKFADIVRRFERLRTQQREAERQAEHLFQTLLHRAFSEGL